MIFFWKHEALGQILLPDRLLLIGQKIVENAKIKKCNRAYQTTDRQTYIKIYRYNLRRDSRPQPNSKGAQFKGRLEDLKMKAQCLKIPQKVAFYPFYNFLTEGGLKNEENHFVLVTKCGKFWLKVSWWMVEKCENKRDLHQL